MRRRLSFVLVAAVAACGAPESPPRAPAVSVAASAPAASFADDARAALEWLVATDTSHGHETDALRPLEEQLRAAGLQTALIESAPGRGNLVARYKGNGKKKPLLLLAHVDVVPVEGQPWTVPPFRVTDKDGFLWGRGVNDDKGMAAAIVAIALELARTRPVLSRDVVFALTAGEETGGFAGAQFLARAHKELIDAEYALNEGGGPALAEDFSRVESVSIGTAEKTFQSYRLAVKGKGGHSSVPPTDLDPVLVLSRALVKIGEHAFPARVIPAAREGLALAARFEKAPLADALAHAAATAPNVEPADERVLAQDRIANALVRTTCVTTQLQGSPQDNVLPTTAEATVNCRILPDETREQTLSALKGVVADPAVEIAPTADYGFGPYSPNEGEVPAAIRKVAQALWPGVPVVSAMSTGATDSRHLRAVGIQAWGVGAVMTSRAEGRAGHTAHGPDERRPAKWLAEGARYLRDVTYELAR